MIPDRVSIHERPAEANGKRFGDGEMDLVIGAEQKSAVLTIIVVSELFGLTSLRSFAIPMVFGLVSGCFSSIFVSGPLWVMWKERKTAK